MEGSAADQIEVPLTDLTARASFVMGVTGDSMEPDYRDGDKVLVERKTELEVGDVGIFRIETELFIKTVGVNGLVSKNPMYAPILPGKEIHCIGKVLGKLAM